MSSRDDTPPLTMVFRSGNRSCSPRYRSKDGPWSIPSRDISVTMACSSPAGRNRSSRSSRPMPLSSSQPLTATLPLRTSAPRMIRPPKRFSQPVIRSGSFAAILPMMAQSAPASQTEVSASSSLMPPPHSTFRRPREAISSRVRRFLGLDALAPSKSTRCSRWTPQSA